MARLNAVVSALFYLLYWSATGTWVRKTHAWRQSQTSQDWLSFRGAERRGISSVSIKATSTLCGWDSSPPARN